MKKKTLVVFLLVTIAIFSSLIVWAWNSPIVQDYYLLHNRDTEFDVAFAFAVALRNNDPAAYDLADANLHHRLDDWMNGHQGKNCSERADTVFLGRGTNKGYQVILDCPSKNKWLSFAVDDIVINDMEVIDWGTIKEE